MDENNYIGGGYGVRSHRGRAANSDGWLVRTIEILKKIVRIALFAMLPWSAYAEVERFPGVQVQLDGLVNVAAPVDNPSAAVSFKAPAQEAIPGHQLAMNIPDVNSAGEIAQSEVVSQEPASPDVVDAGALKQIQNPQPASIVPLDSASLEVVDTGTSRQVQKPQPAAVVSVDEESPAALETEVNTATARVDDHQAKKYKVMLPATDVAEKNKTTGTVGAETGKKSGQTDGVSGDAASGEIIQLPYAVLLAILALMSMIPISRRNG